MNHRISDSASFLKISRTQASIYCKFLLVLSEPLEKCVYSICFACGPKSVLRSISRIQSSLMYYCLPEPNATRVIKITKRNKTLSPITVRRRVEIKFSVESAFLYLVFCNKLVHVCGLTALRHMRQHGQWNRPNILLCPYLVSLLFIHPGMSALSKLRRFYFFRLRTEKLDTQDSIIVHRQ